MKILQVSHCFASHCGGVEIVAEELARRLTERGHEVSWAATSLHGIANPSAAQLLPMHGTNVVERALAIPYPIWGPFSLHRLFQAVRHCDVLHLHDCLYFGNVAAFLAARWYRKPVVVTQHIGLVPYHSSVIRALMATANALLGRLVLGGSDQTVFLSTVVRDYFSARVLFRPLPELIPNGVDSEVFTPANPAEHSWRKRNLGFLDDRPLVLFVGRFVEKKGLSVLRPVCKRLIDCQWLFVGWGPEDPAGWNLPHVRRIERAPRGQMADLYRAADLLVLPSRGEGFPLVVQEAMSCGTPVLITPETAAGCPQVDTVAWTCPPESVAWESRVRELLADSARLIAQRPLVHEFARTVWDWEKTVDAYEAVYRRLSGSAATGADLPKPAAVPSNRPLKSLAAK